MTQASRSDFRDGDDPVVDYLRVVSRETEVSRRVTRQESSRRFLWARRPGVALNGNDSTQSSAERHPAHQGRLRLRHQSSTGVLIEEVTPAGLPSRRPIHVKHQALAVA